MSNRLGHRHVFGVLVPDFNSVVEPEFASLQLDGVVNQTTRFALDATVLENISLAAERLSASGVQSWIVGLATESFPGGLALLESGAQMLRERTGLPVYTPTHGVFRLLEEIGAKTIGVVTPFDDAANLHVRSVYEERGYEVGAVVGLDRPGFDEIASTTDEESRRAFAEAAAGGVDALVQVGTGLPTLHLIPEFESQHGVPVLSSNAAAYWLALRSQGIQDRFEGKGAVFARPSPMRASACTGSEGA